MIELDGQFLPEINDDKCIFCGNCLDLCPGIDLFPPEFRFVQNPNDLIKGHIIESYIAYSKNEEFRNLSTSGGLITTLVSKLIEDKIYDVAFVLDFKNYYHTPARIKPTKNVIEIVNSAKSKYIPASLYEVLRFLKEENQKKCIFIAPSCLMLGIKKYLKKFNISLERNLFLGLFCSNTLSFNFLRFYKDKYASKKENIKHFYYRTKEKFGWPGHTKIVFDSNRTIFINRNVRISLRDFFSLTRCLYCYDKFNILSDISFGDCYIKEKSDPHGKSNILIRTKKGKNIFDNYSYLFNIEGVKINDIFNSQNIKRKVNNYFNAINLINQKNLYSEEKLELKTNFQKNKNLKKLKKKIKLGTNYNFKKIQIKLFFSSYFNLLKHRFKGLLKRLKSIIIPLFLIFENILISRKKADLEKNKNKQNILIFNGKFFNEGSQLMSLVAYEILKQKYPEKNIYHISNNMTDIKRYEEQRKFYNIKMMSWIPQIKFLVLRKFYKYVFRNSKYDILINQLLKIFKNTSFIIDLSGFALSSQRGPSICQSYILNLLIAKKLSIAIYLFPQSFGPFNFPLKDKFYLYPLLRICLNYPQKIFAREVQGLSDLRRFSKDNTGKAYDIVLQHNINLPLKAFVKNYKFKEIEIIPNSIAIIPNKRVTKRSDTKEIYNFYKSIITYLIEKKKKNIYLLSHSSQDLSICKEIKRQNEKFDRLIIINEQLNSIELDKVIKQFDFIIPSRYHAIIQGYKNGVPCIVVGWASKYDELLKRFDQINFYFDIRKKIDINDFINKIDYMISNLENEKDKINYSLKQIQQSPSPFLIFKNKA